MDARAHQNGPRSESRAQRAPASAGAEDRIKAWTFFRQLFSEGLRATLLFGPYVLMKTLLRFVLSVVVQKDRTYMTGSKPTER